MDPTPVPWREGQDCLAAANESGLDYDLVGGDHCWLIVDSISICVWREWSDADGQDYVHLEVYPNGKEDATNPIHEAWISQDDARTDGGRTRDELAARAAGEEDRDGGHPDR